MEEKQKVDLVNEPPHYKFDGIELIDVIKAKLNNSKMSPYTAAIWIQCIQYLFRFDVKGNDIQDLEKARFYLNEIIKEKYKDTSVL